MNLYMIIGLVAIVIVIFLALKIFKGIFKVVFSVAGSLLVIVVILGVIVYMDAQKINTLMEEGDKIILYEHNNSCVTGIRLEGKGVTFASDGSFPEGVSALNAEECSLMLESAKNKEIEDNLMLIINEEVFSEVKELDVYGYKIDREQAEIILLSDKPKEAVISMVLEEENVSKEVGETTTQHISEELDMISEEEVQASIFLLLSNEVLNEEGQQYLLEQVKEENIDIYPQFIIVEGIQWMPDRVFDGVVKKIEEMQNQSENNNNISTSSTNI